MNADHEALNQLLLAVLAHGRAQGLAVLNPAQRIAFLIMELDAYAREGELHGFYGGPFGGRAADLVEALEAIGALQSAALIRRANAVFPHGRPSMSETERLATLHRFSEETREQLHAVGREFLEDYDTLSQRLQTFARERRAELAEGL